MRTAEQIIEYLEAELAEADKLHEASRGVDAQQALIQLIRATILMKILDDIKK